jgi:DNA repair protein RecN (Recombination protein N)
MLKFLSIRDFVIVDQMELEFVPGFTVLTGETGAGKSILIDALSLVLGERGDPSQVRNGCERADISAEFDITGLQELEYWLHENGFVGDRDDGGSCLMRRTVDMQGRSRGFINGRLATMQQLRAAGERLVDIHGQHAHQSMLRSEAQRALLDEFAGSFELAQAVKEAYDHWQDLTRRCLAWEKDAASLAQEREQLERQVNEISALNLMPDEWQALQADHSRLSHAASLLEAAQIGLEVLSEGESAALSRINSVISHLQDLLRCDPSLQAVFDLLESAQIQLQEAVYELSRYRQNLDLEPEQLSALEDRLSTIHAVARKYRIVPLELPPLLCTASSRLEELDQSDNGQILALEEVAAREKYAQLARKLSSDRGKAASELGREVTAAMQTLAMVGGEFSIALIPHSQPSASGLEHVEFQVSAHRGLPLRPLAKVASGGELSRISLAIQVITSKLRTTPTLIFDEVDSGIGGRVAEIVGGLLKKLGRERQVMCITHLPQVASAGDHQWQVSKSLDPIRGLVTSRIAVLADQERIDKIARMLEGKKITETTRRHAAEMLSGNL